MVMRIQGDDEPQTPQHLWREALSSSSIGWEISLPIVGGAFLGQVIDRLSGNSYVFTITFLFVGVFSGFYNLVRAVQRMHDTRTTVKGRPISDEEWEAWDKEWDDEWDDFFVEDEDDEEYDLGL
ncbi:MAG TPA: AtpZ/AtpI family protein [Chloroflexi bacterium]|nr:AtpZ/AtpI family protein [Chloroflexota bacterium]